MNVFIEPSGRLIEPFLDPPGASPIQGTELYEWQARAFREAGLTVVESPKPPCLVVPDTVLITSSGIRRFIEGCAGKNGVLVLKSSVFGDQTVPVQPHVIPVDAGWRFEKIRCLYSEGECADVLFDPEEKIISMPTPEYYIGISEMKMGIPKHPVMTLHHWVHILWANQLMGGWEALATPMWKWVVRGLWAAVRSLSVNKWKVLGKMNVIGRGCDIHHTAVVEGCKIGDGASIGPHCFVRASTIGAGSTLMAGAQVELSVLGERCIVTQQTVLKSCVLYPEAVASQYLMQLCVLGRQVVTTGGAFTMDLNFEGDIRVPLDGALHSSGQRVLGGAFGHRCRIGTGFWMASGRMVPNDYFLIRDPSQVLAKLPPDLQDQGPLKVAGRILEPLTLQAPKSQPAASEQS
ncbi:MAG: hypothetical protein ACE366_09830 [Bradymonadia bacterium]